MACGACHPYVTEAVIEKREGSYLKTTCCVREGRNWFSRIRVEERDSQWRVDEEIEHSIPRTSKCRMGTGAHLEEESRRVTDTRLSRKEGRRKHQGLSN